MNLTNELDLLAYGTSESVRKAWDTRGRGKKKPGTAPTLRTHHQGLEKSLKKAITHSHDMMTMDEREKADMLGSYHQAQHALGKLSKLDIVHEKLEHYEEVKSAWGKVLHIVKSLGEYSQGFREVWGWLEKIAGVLIIGRAMANAQVLTNIMHHVMQHVHPIITAMSQGMSMFGEEDDIQALSQFGDTGWQYGKRTIAHESGYLPTRSLAGFPGARGHGKRLGGIPSHPPGQRHSMPKPQRPQMAKPYHVKFPHADIAKIGKYPSIPKPRNVGIAKPSAGKLGRGFGGTHGLAAESSDWGEPMAGGMSHAHIDPIAWFHPPSLVNREDNEKLRTPVDQPRETNDKFGDVTKRNSKDTKEFKMKLLKRGGPGGLPPQIPVHTTLVAPHTAAYMPTSMWAAGRRRRQLGGGMATSYDRRGCI